MPSKIKTQYQAYFFVILLSLIIPTFAFIENLQQCEPIEILRCKSMPYDLTVMPNFVGHNSQHNARLVFEVYEFIIDKNCSDVIHFLMCSVFTPICPKVIKTEKALLPCRNVCEKARSECEPVLFSLNMTWPLGMECSQLPTHEHGMCLHPNHASERPKECRCKRHKPSFKTLSKFKYDYAVRVQVNRKKVVTSGETRTFRGKILRVLFSKKNKMLKRNVAIKIQTNISKCACAPQIRPGRQHIVLGHSNGSSTLLVLSRHSTAHKWKRKYTKKIKKWLARMKRQALRQKQRWGLKPDKASGKRRPRQRHRTQMSKFHSQVWTNNELPIVKKTKGYKKKTKLKQRKRLRG